MRVITRGAAVRLAIAATLLAAAGLWGWAEMFRMPGRSHRGPLPRLSGETAALRDLLRRHVEVLAGEIGERHLLVPRNLERAAAYVEHELAAAGYRVGRQSYEPDLGVFAPVPGVARVFHNLEAERPGADRADEIVVVGAHYDTILGSRGANDNASGVAALLAVARRFASRSPARTVRFVAFANEEVFFQRPGMGSLVYARELRRRGDRVVTMLSLETMAYYSDMPGSQRYPPLFRWFYPSAGNFLAFVGNVASRREVRAAIEAFRRHAGLPSEGLAIPNVVPGVAWSDHWAFWQAGYPGVMVTDTALYRYDHYHTPDDTPDKLDYDRLARAVAGLAAMLGELAGAPV